MDHLIIIFFFDNFHFNFHHREPKNHKYHADNKYIPSVCVSQAVTQL